MTPADTLRVVSSSQALERLSIGEHIQGVRIAGLLDLDPLVISRWLCGEDMRGIYQPILLRECVIDGIDLEGRTFYEMVELVGCRVTAAHFARAYFYSILTIEDCIFEGDFQGRGIQSDGRLIVHNTVFNGRTEFDGISLRGRTDLVGVSFRGGTNLLHVLANEAQEQIGREIRFSKCKFRASDVPEGLDAERLGIEPFVDGGLRGAES